MEVHRTAVGTEQPVHRRIESEALLDCVRDEAAVGADERELMRELQEAVDDVADQQRRGGRARDEEELAEAEHLLVGQPLAFALDGQQPGQ